jgi:predicted ATPase
MDEQTLVRLLSQELGRRQRLVSAQEVAWVGGQRLSFYHFRHYLFQQYLYQSLDATERAYLHEAVGSALESIYGEQAAQIAVQLAHHFGRAGLTDKRAGALFLAGRQAQRLAAYQVAIHHLMEGLALLEMLPKTPARSLQELDYLGTIISAMTIEANYDSHEVERVCLRAYTLGNELGEQAKMGPILSGLFWVHYLRGEYRQARSYAEEMLQRSENDQSPEMGLIGRWLMADALLAHGEFALCATYAEGMLKRYDPLKHRELFYLYSNVDPKVAGLQILAAAKWLSGHPGQARQYNEVALRIAADSGHPYVKANALLQAAFMNDLWLEVGETEKHNEAMVRLATEHQFFFMLTQGHIHEGCVLIAQGQAAMGMERLLQGIAEQHAVSNKMAQSHHASLQVRGYAALGQSQKGIEVIDAALAAVEQSGEHWFDAELHRLKGELLLMQGETVATVEEYYEKAIEIARRQQGRLWELRATVSLARLWQAQGRHAEAYARLAEIYGWFTEGFGTPDLQEAKALLDSLA